MVKYTAYNGFILLMFAGVISGCVTTVPQHSAADKVAITEGPIAKNCKLKGQVSTADSAHDMSTPSQHSQLKTEEYSSLKEQARKLGANTVLLSSSSGMTEKKHWASKAQHREQATHIYSGSAYSCPAS